MAKYNYRCLSCSHEWGTEKFEKECPNCNSNNIRPFIPSAVAEDEDQSRIKGPNLPPEDELIETEEGNEKKSKGLRIGLIAIAAVAILGALYYVFFFPKPEEKIDWIAEVQQKAGKEYYLSIYHKDGVEKVEKDLFEVDEIYTADADAVSFDLDASSGLLRFCKEGEGMHRLLIITAFNDSIESNAVNFIYRKSSASAGANCIDRDVDNSPDNKPAAPVTPTRELASEDIAASINESCQITITLSPKWQELSSEIEISLTGSEGKYQAFSKTYALPSSNYTKLNVWARYKGGSTLQVQGSGMAVKGCGSKKLNQEDLASLKAEMQNVGNAYGQNMDDNEEQFTKLLEKIPAGIKNGEFYIDGKLNTHSSFYSQLLTGQIDGIAYKLVSAEIVESGNNQKSYKWVLRFETIK